METEPRFKYFSAARFAVVAGLPGLARSVTRQKHQRRGKLIRLAAAPLVGVLVLTTQISLAAAQDPNLRDLFEQRYQICHKKLAGIARKKLITVYGRLYGRYTDRDIAEFMNHHGRLNKDEEVRLIIEELRRLSGDKLEE